MSLNNRVTSPSSAADGPLSRSSACNSPPRVNAIASRPTTSARRCANWSSLAKWAYPRCKPSLQSQGAWRRKMPDCSLEALRERQATRWLRWQWTWRARAHKRRWPSWRYFEYRKAQGAAGVLASTDDVLARAVQAACSRATWPGPV